MGCYRKGDYDNPDMFSSGLRTLFVGYPEEVARKVSNPATGVAGTIGYPPSMAEIRSACEKLMRPIAEAEARRLRDLERTQRLALRAPVQGDRKAFIAKWRARSKDV